VEAHFYPWKDACRSAWFKGRRYRKWDSIVSQKEGAEERLIKIVLDTNVLISALLFGGKPKQILERAVSGEFRMITCREILEELEGVLCGKKFKYPPEIVRNIINEIEALSEIVAPVQAIRLLKVDPYDNVILECALEARADYIISEDVHLLELLEVEGGKIINPAQFLEIVAEGN